MEFLIKKLHLEDKVNELGVDMNANPVLNSQELDNLRNQMVNENKDLQGNNKFEQSEINNQSNINNNNNQNNEEDNNQNNNMFQSNNFQNSQENFNNQSQQQ
jgi:penicillin-binding protein 1A